MSITRSAGFSDEIPTSTINSTTNQTNVDVCLKLRRTLTGVLGGNSMDSVRF